MGFRKSIDTLKKREQQPHEEQPPPPPYSESEEKQSEPEAKCKWTLSSIREESHAKAMKDPNHPVHKIPAEKQEKMRAKGVDPVLRAEMDAAPRSKRGFWESFFAICYPGV